MKKKLIPYLAGQAQKGAPRLFQFNQSALPIRTFFLAANQGVFRICGVPGSARKMRGDSVS